MVKETVSRSVGVIRMGSNPILRKEFVRSLKMNPTALAQLVEHRAFNPIAKGSSPLRGTRVDELSKIIS